LIPVSSEACSLLGLCSLPASAIPALGGCGGLPPLLHLGYYWGTLSPHWRRHTHSEVVA
jgi:hypothetical protein